MTDEKNVDIIATEINLPDQHVRNLQKLIGIDLKVALPIFYNRGGITYNPKGGNMGTKVAAANNKLLIKKVDNNIGGFSENLIALLIGEPLPGNTLGSDFSIFESKARKAYYLKKSDEIRGIGDMPISSLDIKSKFKDTVLYDKMKSILTVYHIDGVIVDIRYLEGKLYYNTLLNDYNLINSNKNSSTKIIRKKSFKTGDSIMIKKNYDVHLSLSLLTAEDEDGEEFIISNNIVNQNKYINDLFGALLDKHKIEVVEAKEKQKIKNDKINAEKRIEKAIQRMKDFILKPTTDDNKLNEKITICEKTLKILIDARDGVV